MGSSELSARDYDAAIENLDDFGVSLKGLIGEALRHSGVAVHSVDYRVKDRGSATKKVLGNEEKYSGYLDLTDLLGVRVITYFPDEVDKVAKALKAEFQVDEINSVDKRKVLDPDQFGYLSLHYVGKLNDDRVGLIEYRRYRNLNFELQVRSILQHAWAEIEHDLGYKTEAGVPTEFRRRFSRLAGILELADDEFSRLRDELNSYKQEVERNISSTPASFELNQSTLAAIVGTEKFIKLDESVARAMGRRLAAEVDLRFIVRRVRELKMLGVEDIAELSVLVESHALHVEKFAEVWNAPRGARVSSKTVAQGIGLFYLEYVLMAMGSDEAVKIILEKGLKFSDSESILAEINETYEVVVRELGDPPRTSILESKNGARQD